MSAAPGHAPAAARPTAKRRASHERHRGERPGQAVRRHLGAARVHAGDPRRARGRAGRPERRGQDHAAEPGGRPGGTKRGRRHRARRLGRRVTGRAGRHRVRRPGHAGVQEPVRRRHAAPDPQPEPALRPALCARPAGRPRHPAEAEGRQAVRRPAGAARADPGAGPPAAAAAAGRADGDARPGRPARLHGHGADGGGRRRRVGGAVLARARRAGAGGRLPHPAVTGPGPGGRRGRRPARLLTAC